MPTDGDRLFLRRAVEAGLMGQAAADEVCGALAQVEALGASSTAREIAINRGVLTAQQADRAHRQAQGGVSLPNPVAAGAPTSAQPATPTARGRAPRTPPGESPPTPIRKTKRLGNFQIIEKLGVGGMGVVYKARQLSMDRFVALKVLPRRLARDRSFIERFLREARSAARLNHPNIVQGIDVGEAEGLYYFAMELVVGESLKDRLKRAGRLSQVEALGIAKQVALGLEHANAHHITHRDIKPDNILLTRSGVRQAHPALSPSKGGVAKLADLGLAKRKSDVAVTQHGGPIGTPLYMSPEQARGKDDVDIRSDIYSLGATLYHAVVGSPPFTGPNSTAIITKHLFEKPPSPRAAVPELTEGFSSVLLKMLAKEPRQRYQSPTDLLEDINRLLNGRPPIRAGVRPMGRGTSTALRRARRRRKRSPMAPVVATTVIVALALMAWLLYSSFAGATEEPVVAAPKPQPRDAYVSRPAPKPPPKRPAPRPRGAEELARVRQWAKAHADEPLEALRRFRELAARYPNTAVARTALAEARAIQRRHEATTQAKSAVSDVCHRAKQLAAAHKFAEAVELLDEFGAEHREHIDEVSEERGFILSQALATERELRGKAGKLSAGGDHGGAIALFEKIIAFGVPKLSARAKREIGLLETRQAEAARTARAEAEQAWLALRLKWTPMLQARRYEAIEADLRAALADPKLAPVKADLEAEAADLAALMGLWKAAEAGARGLRPKEQFSVGGIRGSFVKFADGVISVQASGVLCQKPLRELTAPEALALAARVQPAKAAATHFASGLFLLAEGKPKAAARAFATGKAAGGNAAHYEALLERRRADAAEADAEALFTRIEELRKAEQWQPLADALAACESKHGKSRSLASRRARVDELALEARLGTLTVADVFHGKVRLVSNGRRVEVAYDFSSPEQLADWATSGSGWALRDGQWTLTGARAVWRAPVEQGLQATVEIADAKGPPGAWGLILTEGGAVRPCYTLALPERIGLKAGLWHQKREVARGSAPFRVDSPRKVALGLRARKLTVAVDGKDVLAWADESEKLPPQRLFVGVGCEGARAVRVSSVRVSALIGEQWASDELARLRVRLHKTYQLGKQPWRSLFNGVSLDPWRAEHGNWKVAPADGSRGSTGSPRPEPVEGRDARHDPKSTAPDHGLFDEPDGPLAQPGAAKPPPDTALINEFGGSISLRDREYENVELRLKVRPLRETSTVRVSLRVSKTGERYGVSVGCRPSSCSFAIHQRAQGPGASELARFGERVALRPGQWYDLRVVAIGSEFRAELNGALLFLARDDRRHGGGLSLDVLHGGAAFKAITLRALD